MHRRYGAAWAFAGLAAGIGLMALAGAGLAGPSGDPPEPEAPNPSRVPEAEVVHFRVAIPRQNYQAIVISPRDGGRRGGAGAVPFMIRSRDAFGTVSDFVLYVKVGETQTITFPNGGWTPATDAALYALGADGDGDVAFAAWGVSSGAAGGGGGSLVRFEPVERNPSKDVEDRERAREFDAFLREVQRTR